MSALPFSAALAVVFAFAPVPLAAQETAPPASAPAPAEDSPAESAGRPASLRLPALTVVELRLLDDVSSKTATAGTAIRLELASPIYLTADVGIPVGTPVDGVVIHAAKGGMGGKAGELLLGAKQLRLSEGTAIPLRSFKLGPAQGRNNETLAFATAVTVGLPALFINGGSARIPAGTVANAKTSGDTEIAVALLSKLPPRPALSIPPAVPATDLQHPSTPTQGEIK